MQPTEEKPDAEIVPIFGSWRNIYLAVVIVNVLWITGAYLFTRFPY